MAMFLAAAPEGIGKHVTLSLAIENGEHRLVWHLDETGAAFINEFAGSIKLSSGQKVPGQFVMRELSLPKGRPLSCRSGPIAMTSGLTNGSKCPTGGSSSPFTVIMCRQNRLTEHEEQPLYDFHTHTFLSDGVLSPMELIRQAYQIGYRTMAITDHVGPGNLEFILTTLVKECEMAAKRWDIRPLPGVEITYVPKEDIDLIAREARSMGAKVVNVHGETVVEPVEPGTNLAAASSNNVDILAHPGLITLEEARIAARNGVILEVSARRGHGFANGHVVKTAREAGALTVLDSDAHSHHDLLTRDFALKVALGAGLDDDEANALLESGPRHVLSKIGLEYVA